MCTLDDMCTEALTGVVMASQTSSSLSRRVEPWPAVLRNVVEVVKKLSPVSAALIAGVFCSCFLALEGGGSVASPKDYAWVVKRIMLARGARNMVSSLHIRAQCRTLGLAFPDLGWSTITFAPLTALETVGQGC
jgi:hypothetical protein